MRALRSCLHLTKSFPFLRRFVFMFVFVFVFVCNSACSSLAPASVASCTSFALKGTTRREMSLTVSCLVYNTT